MKKNPLFLSLALLMLLVNLNAQIGNRPIFNNSYYGFATGVYPGGQSPSEVRAADLDNDGDSDFVVAQQNFAKGFVVLKNLKKGFYAAGVKYNSPMASEGIVVADLNNDGRNDVALTNTGQFYNGSSVSVFLNRGGGNFNAAVNYTVGSGPVGITAADFDNDGDNDLAVCNLTSAIGSVSVLINNGNGSFNPAVNFQAGIAPFRIIAAKINNDNLVDLVVADNTQTVNILFNGGNNDFSTKTTLNVIYTTPIDDGNSNIQAADFDNDGDNDLVFSSMKTFHTVNEIALFVNKGNGTYDPPKFLQLNGFVGSAWDLDVADFNNDGKKDILTCFYSGRTGDGYEILLNLGNNNFSVPEVKPAGQSTQFITAADVDNDNKVDVITSDFYSLQVTVHKNAGNASFPIPSLYATNNSVAGSLDAADIDGDGDLDVLTSASGIAAVGVTVTVLKNNGNGSFTPGIAYSIRAGGVQAKFRDLNGDGKPDIIFATAISSPPYDFHTAINNGDGTFGPRQTWSMNACGWSDIDAIDVDGDGDNDAVITEWLGCTNIPNSARRLFISKNNGNGSFAAPVIKLISPSPSCVATGDFNNDGRPDIATGQSLSVDVHLNSGNNGLFNAPVTYATAESVYDMIAVDVNNDGKLDLAACTEFNHEGMSVLIGNGDGSFKPAQNYDGAYSPDLRNESGITSGDIDADGDIDILVGNYASNDVSVYLNKGNGSFNFIARVGMYYGVASPVYADFTGDGKKDIVALTGFPPSGIESRLCIITGNILNADNIAGKPDEKDKSITNKTTIARKISVVNNPFDNYIDIKFSERPTGKVQFVLHDLSGKQIAKTETTITGDLFRFNINDRAIKSGVYTLTVNTKGRTDKFLVVH